MASFRVVTEQLSGQAATISSLGGALEGASQQIVGAGDAAADTQAAGALAAATSTLAGALGQYAAATHQLASAVSLAAECYAVTDASAVPNG